MERWTIRKTSQTWHKWKNLQMDQVIAVCRRARDQVDGQYGRKVLLKQGVQQREVLPPTLRTTVCMNDLVPELQKEFINHSIHADDIVLSCSEEYATTAKDRIQNTLDMIVTRAKRNTLHTLV